jgi:hypothetical protein
MQWYDILGTLGVMSIIVAFAAVQSGRLAPTRLSYSLMNLIGAILILVSLSFNFNLASVVIEIFWILISLWGIVSWIKTRRALNQQQPK